MDICAQSFHMQYRILFLTYDNPRAYYPTWYGICMSPIKLCVQSLVNAILNSLYFIYENLIKDFPPCIMKFFILSMKIDVDSPT